MSTSHVIKMLSGFSHDGFPTGRLALTHFKLRSPSVLTTWFPSFEICTFRKKSQGTQVERNEPKSLAQASRRRQVSQPGRTSGQVSEHHLVTHGAWTAWGSLLEPKTIQGTIYFNFLECRTYRRDRRKPWTDSTMSCAGCSSQRMLQADPP